jgi:Zn-dependent protease with chaperone function
LNNGVRGKSVEKQHTADYDEPESEVDFPLFARPLSYLIESAVYRAREFLADRTAAILVGGPGPLISALKKLQETDHDTCESTVGSLICCVSGKKSTFRLLNMHPDLTTRIRLLSETKPT